MKIHVLFADTRFFARKIKTTRPRAAEIDSQFPISNEVFMLRIRAND